VKNFVFTNETSHFRFQQKQRHFCFHPKTTRCWNVCIYFTKKQKYHFYFAPKICLWTAATAAVSFLKVHNDLWFFLLSSVQHCLCITLRMNKIQHQKQLLYYIHHHKYDKFVNSSWLTTSIQALCSLQELWLFVRIDQSVSWPDEIRGDLTRVSLVLSVVVWFLVFISAVVGLVHQYHSHARRLLVRWDYLH